MAFMIQLNYTNVCTATIALKNVQVQVQTHKKYMQRHMSELADALILN